MKIRSKIDRLKDLFANLATYPAVRKHYQLLRLKQTPILKVENLYFRTHMKLFCQEIFKKLWMMLHCLLNWHQLSLKQQKSVSSRHFLRHARIVSEDDQKVGLLTSRPFRSKACAGVPHCLIFLIVPQSSCISLISTLLLTDPLPKAQ